MAGEDYSLKTKVEADVTNFEKGMNKAEKSLKGFSDKLANSINRLGKKGLVGSLGSVGLALGGVITAVSVATKAVKKISQTIGECTEAFRKQNKAEIALETSIKNNPYVDGSALKGLKEFASEMQKTSEIGDEEFLLMMSQLIATGRTEAETMDIIKVATDMSATGTMSFETAVQQLNATLNGNIGRLGQQNSELKNLTEEELKSGKAVEILGNKYKGLAESTVDTSKQLKNAIGDFKELIGQSFETALAPMRKYFTEIITNVNDAIKKAREEKEAFDAVFGEDGLNTNAETEKLKVALDSVLEEYRKVYTNQQQYLQMYGKYIDEETDETAKSYREQVKKLSDDIKKLSEEIVSRKKQAQAEAEEQKTKEEQLATEKEISDLKDKYLKKIAEQEAKWQNIKTVTGEAVKNEERLKFYQDQLVTIMTESGGKISENNQYYKDQMAIINSIMERIQKSGGTVSTEWIDKLREQRIELLEEEKEEAIENAKEKGEDVYAIEKNYNEKILDLKLEKLVEEREKALSQENLTAEDKLNINTYYNNEIMKTTKQLRMSKKKEGEEESKDEKNKLQKMLGYVKVYAERVKKIFSNIADIVKKVFSAIGNIFNKALDIFNMNPDEILTNLLKVEDSILTFFTETLPKFPQFVSSAVQSIVYLIDSLISNIDWQQVNNIITSLIQVVIDNMPKIIKNLLDLVINVAESLVEGLINFVESGGWKMILDLLLTIQKRLEKFVTDNINDIVDTIIDMLPDLVRMLIDSIVSASKTLAKLIKPIIRLVMALIEAILEVLLSDEVFDAGLEALTALIEAIISEFIPRLAVLVVKFVPKIAKSIIASFPKLVVALIKGFVEAFTKTNWIQVVKDIFTGFVEGIKDFFGIHSPSTLFESFGVDMIKGLWNGIKNLGSWLWNNVTSFFSNLVSGIKGCFNGIGEWFGNLFSGIFNKLGEWFGNCRDAIKNALSFIGDKINGLISNTKGLFTTIGEKIKGFGETIWEHTLGHFFATGTNAAPRGLAVVGEQGPELVRFRGGEQVINNRNTQKLLAGANGNTNNFNVTFNNLQDTSAFAMMNQLKQYNRQMAINGII